MFNHKKEKRKPTNKKNKKRIELWKRVVKSRMAIEYTQHLILIKKDFSSFFVFLYNNNRDFSFSLFLFDEKDEEWNETTPFISSAYLPVYKGFRAFFLLQSSKLENSLGESNRIESLIISSSNKIRTYCTKAHVY